MISLVSWYVSYGGWVFALYNAPPAPPLEAVPAKHNRACGPQKRIGSFWGAKQSRVHRTSVNARGEFFSFAGKTE